MFRVSAFGFAILVWLPPAAGDGSRSLAPVSLDVRFKLTDLDYKPIAGAPVRLVFGSDPQWQRSGAGQSFATGPTGEYRFTTPVTLDQRMKKLPTNFADSVLSQPKPTDHLLVAAELQYASFHWLYAVDVFRFSAGGDVLTEGVSVYTRDAKGDFTRKATQDRSGWHMADLGDMVLTMPGHDAWDWMLQPDPSDATRGRWTLNVAFKRSPAPVRR